MAEKINTNTSFAEPQRPASLLDLSDNTQNIPHIIHGRKPELPGLLNYFSRCLLQGLRSLITFLFNFFSHPFILFPTSFLFVFWGGLALISTAFNLVITCFSNHISQFTSFATPSFGLMTYFYCTVLAGPYFCPHTINQPETTVSQITRSISKNVMVASDIFDSIMVLGNPHDLAFHQAEILELALAIEYSTKVDHRAALAQQLWELSELTSKVKDEVINLNGVGINTFSFLAHEVSSLDLVPSNTSRTLTRYLLTCILVLKDPRTDWECSVWSFNIHDPNRLTQPWSSFCSSFVGPFSASFADRGGHPACFPGSWPRDPAGASAVRGTSKVDHN